MPETTDPFAAARSSPTKKVGVLTADISSSAKSATAAVGNPDSAAAAPDSQDKSARKAPPYPVAALLRRTRNAKSGRDLHDIAFNGWEASMRLAVAARPPADVSTLFEPATGAWAAALRSVLSETRLDDPHLKAVYALFSRVGAGINAAPMVVTPKMLFEYIASYRNQLHGHGAVRGAEFYDSAGEILLNGLEAAWRQWLFLPDGSELVFVQSVELDAAGQRRARIYLLTGGEPMLESRVGTPDIPEGLRPRRLYLRIEKRFYSLHPWLLYEDKDERERVLYYNGRNKYLDFISGETPRVDKLSEAYPTLAKELDALFKGKAGTIFPDGNERNPNDFGDYEIICELGRGGMAAVCLAIQKSLERRVALKMPLPGVAKDSVAIQRFEREIQVLSRCDHPNVVKILDSGVHDGTPYYVMEYIEGADLARISQALSINGSIDDAISSATLQVKQERAERMNLPMPMPAVKTSAAPGRAHGRSRQEVVVKSLERLAGLIRDAARGLHHLHCRGILHRDIKPGNLMLTESEHRIVVMDLGLAGFADMQTTLARDVTALLGTLRYMAPEQLQRQPIALDRRADVYSLCATFYELLAGKPFLDGVSEQQLLHQILYEEPIPLGRANPLLPRDIQMIVAKGIQKDPQLRYHTADELANDLTRWLNGDPILARDPSLAYLLSLSIRKHKALVSTAIAAFILVLGVAVLAVTMRQNFLKKQNELAEGFVTIAQKSEHKAAMLRAQEQLVSGSAMENDGMFGLAKKSYESAKAHFIELGESVQEAETHLNLLYLRHRPPVFAFEGHREIDGVRGRISVVAIAPHDENVALTAGEEGGTGVVKLWDLRTGQESMSRRTIPGDRILSARFSPDGTKVLYSGWLSKLNLWNLKTGKVTPFSHAQEATASVAFSPDGRFVATGSYSNTVRIWDAGTATEIDKEKLPGAVIRTIAFSANDTLCFGVSDGTIYIRTLDRAVGKLALRMKPAVSEIPAHKGGVNGVAFYDDGKKIISCGDDRLFKLWNAADGTEIDQAYGHPSEVVAVATFDRDKRAISASGTTLRIWDLDNITEPQTIECGWHESGISGIAVLADSRRVLTACADGSLMMWNLPYQKFTPFDAYRGYVNSVRLSNSGKLALTAGENGVDGSEFKVRLWDVESGLQVREFAGLKAPFRSAIFSADQKRILAVDKDGCVLEWKIDGPAEAPPRIVRAEKPHPPGFLIAAFSPDGTRCAVGLSDAKLEIVDVDAPGAAGISGTPPLDTLEADDAIKIVGAGFSMDGKELVTSNMEGTLRVWKIGSKERPRKIASPGNSPVFGIVLTPDGKCAIAGGMDFICRMWDLEKGTLIRTFEGHTNSVFAVAYSAARRQIATGSMDQSIRIWNASDGRELYSFKALKGSVYSLAFSSDAGDGNALIYGCKNGGIELLDFDQAAHIRKLQGEIAVAQNVLKTQKDDVRSLTIVGEWLSLQGAWADATLRMEEARRLDPAGFDGYSLLGKCYWILAKAEADPTIKAKFLNSAYEAYRYQSEKLKLLPSAATAPEKAQELTRYNLILNALLVELKKTS